jgi:hypothetical protein
MPGNAVEATRALLTAGAVDKMAAIAGVDPDAAQRVVQAGAPAILNGLTDVVCKPAGIQRLACAIVKQSSDPWEGLARPAQGSAHDLLISLFGENSAAALTSSVGKFTGVSEPSTRTLLHLLAPAIVAALGQERRNAGVDALGIAEVIGSQKELIAAAMPAGLSSLLQANGFCDQLGAVASSPRRRSITRPLAAASAYCALPLLALAGLAFYALGDRTSWETMGERIGLTGSSPQLSDRFAPDIAFLSAVRGDWVSVGAYYGRSVYDRHGDKLGIITDLLMGPDDSIAAAVIGVERSLGIGHKDVAVPFSMLRRFQRRSDGNLIVDTASEQLRSAPAFEPLDHRNHPGDAEGATAERLSERRP